MSAVRRRVHRNNLPSPYARPHHKKSLWNILSFLNPFGTSTEPEDVDSDGEIEQGSPPRRFSPPPPPPPPAQQQSSSNSSRPSGMIPAASTHITQSSPNLPFSLNPLPSGSSLAKNLEPVTRFLVEKAGQPLNDFEAAGIMDYIQKNVQGSSSAPDRPEPFRFSVSPSRSASPTQTQGISNTQPPRKTLSRNPNGVYRWQGAGSSRPRNRYQSPGFTRRPQQHGIKLPPPKSPVTTDTKRRRVDEVDLLTPQKPSTPTAGFPDPILESPAPHSRHSTGPSASFLNGKPTASSVSTPIPPTTPKVNGTQIRLRTGMKPTAPAIPSPLRQTWKESDSPPQASPPSRPTRAAGFMTELIKEVTPVKKPDVSNPYQTASPVKPPAPVRKPVARRAKHAAKPAEEPKEQETKVSAQAIIEATVPKGTKRSRPPLEMEKSNSEEGAKGEEPFRRLLNGSTQAVRSTVNVVGAITILDVEESSPKRRKTPPTSMPREIEEVRPIRPAEIIEPVDDIIHINGKTAASPPTPLLGIVKTSAPKEPSKLRYSFYADKVEVKGADAAPAPPPPSFAPTPFPSISKDMAAPAKTKLLPKEEALAMNVDELPKFTFPVRVTSPLPAGPSFTAARNAVVAMAITTLPTYEFGTVLAPVRAMDGFNWTAAGVKAPITPAYMWTCTLCGLQNPAQATEKCTICDAPRPAPTDSSVAATAPPTPSTTAAPSAPVTGFDWSAAGMAPPSKPQGGGWTCSLCSLSNPASVTDKCTVCDTPR